jgi:hypothetical protein
VYGVRVEHVNGADLREYYPEEVFEMFARIVANRDELVCSVRVNSVRVDLFGNRRGVVPPPLNRRPRSLAAASRASSPAVPPPVPEEPHTPTSSVFSNAGVGPIPSDSPRYQPRAEPRSPSYDPLADDPPHVVVLRAFIETNGVQNPDFNARVMHFAAAHLRTMEGSAMAQQLLGVMEPTGEPFVREFRTFLNAHGDHTHAEFQTRLGGFVEAYLARLHPERENYNFAMRMFFAFQQRDGFRDLLARIAGGVPLSGP